MTHNTINISEIFYSLQGEALEVGLPTVFIRLIGCPLRCSYCDSEYAFYGKNLQNISQIIHQVKKYNTKYICVTGGEPLAQKNCQFLLDELVEQNYKVSVETSGSIDISVINLQVSIVMDIKTPSSNENEKNLLNNLRLLKSSDQLKFVIGNKADFDWSMNFLKQNSTIANVLFSPIANTLNPTDLANWILENQLNVRMQVQLHKILWGDVAGK